MADYMFVGSFGGKTGIRFYRFDPETGGAELIQSIFPEINVGHALVDDARGLIYVTNERPDNPAFAFGGGGEVYALSVDGESGRLRLWDKTLSYGALPTYSAMDRAKRRMIVPHFAAPFSVVTKVEQGEDGRFEIVPVFSDSNTVLLSLKEDGAFGGVLDIYTHPMEEGYAENPHLHSVNRSPLCDLYAVCDMGTDKLYLFRIENDKLVPAGNSPLQLSKGCGPRYGAFHPAKPWLFIDCEREPLVKAFSYDNKGDLREVCSVSALPRGVEPGPNDHPSGLALSGGGNYLYVLVRGSDLVSVYKTDGETGALEMIQAYQLAGRGPRGCSLSPGGKYLAVANKDSGTVEVLAVNPDGPLSAHGVIENPSPGVVAFVNA